MSLSSIFCTSIVPFFPIVEQKLQEEERSGYTGKAVLILDGFACHKKALEAFNLEEKRVEIVFLHIARILHNL